MTDDLRPGVLIIGGFLSSPPFYGPLRARLLARGAARVDIAPIWLPDWLLIPWRGQGQVAARAARAVLHAGSKNEGAPLLLVGHSAGGVVARILTAEVPFAGRRYAGSPRIGAIVTLGTPHANAMEAWTSRRSRVYPWLRRSYERVMPPPYPGIIEGDGVVPVSCALLPGARQIVLDDAAHGQATRHPWYGSEKYVDAWWPAAVEVWRDALAARP